MKFLYENVESLVAKVDFECKQYNKAQGETITSLIKKGTKGTIKSLECSSIDKFKRHYEILFQNVEGKQITVSFLEETIPELLALQTAS